MDKELRKLDEFIEYENSRLEYEKKVADKLVVIRETRIISIEGEKIERLLYLIQKRIAIREKKIERMVLQERFRRQNRGLSYTLFISAGGYLMHCIYGSDYDDANILEKFDFEDKELMNSIARKPVINTLLEIYISLS